ncbi:helix-turn-helix domain-containing protein [Candidatus Saccharibacteria bacterium]|nr:helix-turn-helix domain-containing protein [Candidatus Saccharibacteria bacterium]MBQ3292695.1 helix-turn-helix domain-containing protein [Candidatus Saccharibacteria bacterium]MBR0431495.1 helix-turn-helix domain-containing protein [Candidatus Saccharibacteria bacterium]
MIKDNLRKQRNLAGISQEKLAEEMQVSRQTISKWENGETYPSTGHVLELAEILGCRVDELIGGGVKCGVSEPIDGSVKRSANGMNVVVVSDAGNVAGLSQIGSVCGKKMIYWVIGALAVIMVLVGFGGIMAEGLFLYDDVKEMGFDRMVDGSLDKAFSEFEKDGYVKHEVVGYGVTDDARFYVKCSLDGEDGPCAALIYFCEMDEGHSYECEYLDDSEFVPKGRYYEVG